MKNSQQKPEKKIRLFREKSGLSLVELLVAMAIGTGVIAIASQMLVQTTSSIGKAKEMGERDRLVRLLQKSLADRVTLLETKKNVPEIAACMDSNDGRPCQTATSAASQIQIAYYSKGSGVIPKTGKLFGPSGEPNIPKGWRVNVWFYALCPSTPDDPNPNPLTCDAARTVYLRFQVKREPDSVVDPKIKSFPLDADFDANKSLFAFAHDVGGFLGLRKGQQCPADSFQVGTTNNGTILCQCRGAGGTVGPEGSCTNVSRICRVTPSLRIYEMMVGIDREGNPICARTRETCDDIKFDQPGGTDKCPNAGWLVNITLGECRAQAAGKKASGERPITCSEDRGRCCWYEIY